MRYLDWEGGGGGDYWRGAGDKHLNEVRIGRWCFSIKMGGDKEWMVEIGKMATGGFAHLVFVFKGYVSVTIAICTETFFVP